MRLLEEGRFGVVSFFGCSAALGSKCGPNGLPLTPSSVQMVGRFQQLRALRHPNLARYLDVQRGGHDVMFVVAEHHDHSLAGLIKSSSTTLGDATPIAFQIASGLQCLHEQNIVHRNLALENILVAKDGSVRLSQYGLYHLTDLETLVSFRIGNPFYYAPEVLAKKANYRNSPMVDAFAFGLILVQVLSKKNLEIEKNEISVSTFVKLALTFAQHNIDKSMLNFYKSLANFDENSNHNLYQLIDGCLEVAPKKRPKMIDVLKLPVFAGGHQSTKTKYYKPDYSESFLNLRRTEHLVPSTEARQLPGDLSERLHRPLKHRPIDEAYFLWKLAGSGVDAVLRKERVTKTRPSMKMLPDVVVSEYDTFGYEQQRRHLTDLNVCVLSMDNLFKRLESVDVDCYVPSLEYSTSCSNTANDHAEASGNSFEVATSQLPKVVREKDIEHQLIRMVLFTLLIDSYPFRKGRLWRESRTDVPPVYRGLVWCGVLGVRGDVQRQYDLIDKRTVTSTDRQIDVDVPRCHQYDELLSSPQSHAKLKRVLKAWVLDHPQYVYWQGLDSLCAPFLYLNYNHESLAYACLKNFVPKYLHDFFLKDNSAVMQEYLTVFNHLIAYHDPNLYFHLCDTGFSPDLYAIPWFLTMFAHLLPLPKLLHLWDTLLLGDDSFPLCVGVAVLRSMRHDLLTFGFNECILLFSDMPEIDIERCVALAVEMFATTPKSAFYRKFMPRPPMFNHHGNKRSHYEQEKMHKVAQMDPIDIADLRQEHCARLCADELVYLEHLRLQSSAPPCFDVLCVDIRPFEEYSRGSFPRAINVPCNLVRVNGSFNLPAFSCSRLLAHKGRPICIIGGSLKDRRAVEFAQHLMRLGYPRLLLLHKGSDVLRQLHLLVPPDNIN